MGKLSTLLPAAAIACAAIAGLSTACSREPVAAAKADPMRQQLIQAFDKLKTAYPYRTTDTSTVTSKVWPHVPPTVRVADYATADRVHMTWNRGPDRGEIIVFGDQTYWRAKGIWRTAGESGRARPGFGGHSDQIVGSGSRIEDVQMRGEEAIDGVRAAAYTFRFTWKTFGMGLSGTGKAWVGAADGLPRRIDLESHAVVLDMTSQVRYEYGIAVDVEPPAL